MAFADALKDFCRVHYKMVGKDARLLQRIGLEFREKEDADFWVRILQEKVKDVCEPIIAITDCRFQNEAAFVRDRGGLLVKVSRLLPDGSLFVADDRPSHHPSETALDAWSAWNYEIQAKCVIEMEEALMATVVSAIRIRLGHGECSR